MESRHLVWSPATLAVSIAGVGCVAPSDLIVALNTSLNAMLWSPLITLPLTRIYRATLASQRKYTVCNTNFAEYEIRYADGWKIVVKTDVTVIETTAPPLTRSGYRAREKLIQRDIFRDPMAIGMFPVQWGGLNGASHISIDIASHFHSAWHMRNFLAYFINHYETQEGIWNRDCYSAEAIWRCKPLLKSWTKIFSEVDEGAIVDTSVLSYRLFSALKRKSASLVVHPKQGRIEIRTAPLIRSARHLLDFLDLLQGIIDFTATLPNPIPVMQGHPDLKKRVLLNRYRTLVEESGEPWKKHAKYLPAQFGLRALFSRKCSGTLVGQ